jgi:deaminated glutathione amidase
MRIGISQMSCLAPKQENLDKIVRAIRKCEDLADLVVFPEYCMGISNGGAPRDYVEKQAEGLSGDFVGSASDSSSSTNVSVVLPIYENDRGSLYDTAVLIEKGKVRGCYRKIHLFNALGVREGDVFKRGNEAVSFSFEGWNFGLIICYDVRFPELSRLLALEGSEVLLVPAAWYRGFAKEEAWITFLRSRASENTEYVVGVGNCSPQFIGRSCLVGPDGIVDNDLGAGEKLVIVELEKTRLKSVRESMPVLSQTVEVSYKIARI